MFRDSFRHAVYLYTLPDILLSLSIPLISLAVAWRVDVVWWPVVRGCRYPPSSSDILQNLRVALLTNPPAVSVHMHMLQCTSVEIFECRRVCVSCVCPCARVIQRDHSLCVSGFWESGRSAGTNNGSACSLFVFFREVDTSDACGQ